MSSSSNGNHVSSQIPVLVSCTLAPVWSYGSRSHPAAAEFDGCGSAVTVACLSQIV